MNRRLRSLLSVAAFTFGLLAPSFAAFGQVPPAVPALPDTERRTSYSISGTTCACAVGMALYGDSTDFQSWVEVYLNGVRVNFNDATFGWTITSPTGALGSIPRPVTDAVLTFNGVQTGTVQIVGARRPRRTSTFAENRGVAARDLNQILNDMIAQNRETWDKTNDVTGRALFAPAGETLTILPSATQRAGALLAFDPSGNPLAVAPGVGTGNVVGPGSSTNGDVACWNGTTGALLKDCGAIGTTTLTGDITGGPAVGTVPTTLATVNPNVGTWGSTTAVPALVVNGKGLITGASNITITPANIGAVPTTRQILGGAGMTAGGALSADVTLGLATIPNNTILANNTGGVAAPGDLTATQVLDMLGTTQGSIVYRNASAWVPLTPGTNGQLLTSGGAAANPSWTTASGTGTVTSVGSGTGITNSPASITGAGTVALTVPVVTANGGTGVVSPATHTIPINQGASAQANTGTGTTGQCVVSNGASADPSFKSGCRVLLNTLTASNSATLSDTTSLTSTYSSYEIVFDNLLPATNAVTLDLQVHSGGSFQSTSYINSTIGFTGGSVTPHNISTTAFVPLSNAADIVNVAPGASGYVRIDNPSGASVSKMVFGLGTYAGSTSVGFVTVAGLWNNAAAIDGFQFLMSSGNITSGTIKIYGFL